MNRAVNQSMSGTYKSKVYCVQRFEVSRKSLLPISSQRYRTCYKTKLKHFWAQLMTIDIGCFYDGSYIIKFFIGIGIEFKHHIGTILTYCLHSFLELHCFSFFLFKSS